MKKMILAAVTVSVAFTSGAEASKITNASQEVNRLLGREDAIHNVFEVQQKKLLKGKTAHQPWSGSYWPDILGGIGSHWRDQTLGMSKIRFALRYGVARSAFKNDFKNVSEKYPEFSVRELSDKLSPSEKYDLLMGDTQFSFTRAIIEETDFRSNHRLTTKKKDGSISDSDEDEGTDNRRLLARPGERDALGNDPAYAQFDKDFEYMYWRKKGGTLAWWSGICDGWGPASLYLPRPAKPVTVIGALGHQITFYPDDIKALGSYLFARTNTSYSSTMNYRFSGRKCSESGTPDTDSKTGFVKDLRCNDLDAGVFHMTLINRIGVDQMGFIMDIDNNNKINNHPVFGYSFNYINPLTGKPSTLEKSMVEVSQLNDHYRSVRNPETRYILGIRATIDMLYYVFPEAETIQKKFRRASLGKRSKDFDSPTQDAISSETYEYDLELDAKGNILGGEWGNRANDSKNKVKYALQPDFIWMADLNILPYSEMSEFAYPGNKSNWSDARPFGNVQWAWDGKSQLPEDWKLAAQADASWKAPLVVDDIRESVPSEAKNSVLKSAQPLSHVVYWLFDHARVRDQR